MLREIGRAEDGVLVVLVEALTRRRLWRSSSGSLAHRFTVGGWLSDRRT
jgi:hypothetical protein